MVKTYHVQPGDTLNKIIDKFELHLNGILSETDINDLKLYEFQTILIPLQVVNSIKLHEYITTHDDTLLKIQLLFNVTSKEISYFNDLNNLILAENQELFYNDDQDVSQVFVVDYDHI